MGAELTRRGFIKVTASAAGASMLLGDPLRGDPVRLSMAPGTPKSRVVKLESKDLLNGHPVHDGLLREGLATVMNAFTGAENLSQSWHEILKPADVIGIKFNRSAQETIGTSSSVAAAIVESLLAAGFSPKKIICLECPDDVSRRWELRTPRSGFSQAQHDFGSGVDHLAAVLDDVTAIVNVPFIKTHNIAGLTCCMKNLSHGFVKHPARYHDNGCSPYVADIVGLEPIRSKLRLNIVDGLRVVYQGGPSASSENIENAGILCVSTDPVATDTVALGQIDAIRYRHDLPPVQASGVILPYLAAAHERGIGIALPFGIEVANVTL